MSVPQNTRKPPTVAKEPHESKWAFFAQFFAHDSVPPHFWYSQSFKAISRGIYLAGKYVLSLGEYRER
jgi:hypothetical protein